MLTPESSKLPTHEDLRSKKEWEALLSRYVRQGFERNVIDASVMQAISTLAICKRLDEIGDRLEQMG